MSEIRVGDLESRIERIPFSGCWIWMGALDQKGYAVIGIRKLHRLTLERRIGKPLGKLFACHHCDVRCCINPYHLFSGTWADNYRDARKKGRFKFAAGEKHGRVKLSAQQVLEIRAVSVMPNRAAAARIATQYGVSKKAILNIWHNRSWKSLPPLSETTERRKEIEV